MELTVNSLKRFIEDPVWREFSKELKEMRTNVLEGMCTETDPNAMLKMSGRAEALKDLIEWPDVQLSVIEFDESKQQKGGN